MELAQTKAAVRSAGRINQDALNEGKELRGFREDCLSAASSAALSGLPELRSIRLALVAAADSGVRCKGLNYSEDKNQISQKARAPAATRRELPAPRRSRGNR